MSSKALPIVATLFVAACGSDGADKAGSAPPPPTVVLATASVTAVPNILELPGRVQAVRTAEVRGRIDGIVERRVYREGSDVRAGQVLYRIDPLPLRAVLDSATAALRRYEADRLNARQNVARFRPLVAEQAISEQEFDAATSRLAQAEAEVRSAQAQVTRARLDLGYATVTAPISGRAGRSAVTEGALVSASAATLLTTIDQLDPVYVNFSQSNAELLALRRAIDRGAIRTGGFEQTRVRLTLEDGGEYEYAGRLNFLDLSVDPSTGGVSLRAQFPNPRRILLPGEFVRARVEAGIDPNAVAIPQRAVQLQPEGANVLTLGAGNRVQVKPVQLGQLVGGLWVVTGGLKAGDRYILEGLQKARPGSVVQPVAPGRATAAPAGPASAR